MIDKVDMEKKRGKSADLLAGLALFFSSLLFFYDLLAGRYLLTERDLGPYFIPPRFFWVESIKGLDFPLWNPYQFSGSPFFANPQHGMLYPLNGLFFLLPFDVAFNVIIVLHFFLAGLFVYLFLRDLKVGPSGSLIAGLVFMLGGYLLSVHSLLSCLLSVIWTPLMMLFFRRVLIRRSFKNMILTALFITLSFLGGGIEIVYGNFFALLLMVLFSDPSHPSPPPEGVKGEGPWKGIGRGMKGLFIVSLLFLSFSAIQLIPFLELFFHSIRKGGISYQEATVWSLAPRDALLFFLPDAYGYFLDMKKYWVAQCWFKTLYTGGLPFILSLVFFLFGTGRKLFFSLMLFSIFLSLGRYNPLYPWVFQYVPFFNGIRYPAKFLYLFILVLSMTAGLGFQRLQEIPKERGRKNLKHLTILLSLFSGFFLLFLVIGHQEVFHFLKGKGIDSPDFNHLSVNLYHAKRFLFYLTLFFLLIRIGFEKRWKGWVKGFVILFLIGDLFGNMGFYGREKAADYFRKTQILERITSDQGSFRVFATRKTIAMDAPLLIGNASSLEVIKEKHLPTMNLLHRVHDIWGIDVLRPKKLDDLYKGFTETPSISTTNLIDLYGVKYVISVTPLEGDPSFELIYSRLEGLSGREEDLVKGNTVKLYRYRNPFRRGWLVKDFQIMDPIAILSRMTQKGFDPGEEVLLEQAPPSLVVPSSGGGKGGGEVEFMSESNNKLELRVRATENVLLVLNDTYFPGWKVFVNDRKERIYRADYAFRAVPLRPGTHRVLFVYRPLSFMIGAAMTFSGIIACLVIGFVIRRKEAPDERH